MVVLCSAGDWQGGRGRAGLFAGLHRRMAVALSAPGSCWLRAPRSNTGPVAARHSKNNKHLYSMIRLATNLEGRQRPLPALVGRFTTMLSLLLISAVAPTVLASENVAQRPFAYRSEERRVGKECRSRWSP